MQQNGNASAMIEAELVPGERVIWSGQPKTGVRLRAKELALILPGLLVAFLSWMLVSFVRSLELEDVSPLVMFIIVAGGSGIVNGLNLTARRHPLVTK